MESTEPNPPDLSLAMFGAVAGALSRLLEPGDFDRAMYAALDLIGRAANADRVYVFQSHPAPVGAGTAISQRYEWARTGVSAEIANPQMQNLSTERIAEMHETLRNGRSYQRRACEFTAAEKELLEPQGIRALLLIPIIFRSTLWGFAGMDDCRTERVWSAKEIDAFKACTAGLGGAIVRREAELALQGKAEELKRHRSVALSLMEDARRSAAAASAASRAKTTFLAMMSHEIRTPLNGVIGFTDLLLAEGLPERQSQLAASIRTCGETLLSLISDILDISRIESGRLEIEATDGNVEDCVRAVIASFEPQADRNGIDFVMQVDPGCVRRLRLDFKRLTQVLFNLIGNAVKFTHEGRITVRLWTEADGEGTFRLWGAVADTGSGISETDQAIIFEPFQQGEDSRRSATSGSGLGLAICRRLLEAMGGGITVESAKGRGSTFTFHVQAEPTATQSPGQAEGGNVSALLSVPARILVVDDVPMNVRLVTSLLARLGYPVDVAHGGREAVRMAIAKTYDVIFMDILMPEVDGFEAARRVLDHARSNNAPQPWIVALTADALAENRQMCAEVGMKDFITKPLRIKDMEECLLRWRRGTPALSAPP